MLMRPSTGLERFAVSSNRMYGYPDSIWIVAIVSSSRRARIFDFLIRGSATISSYFSVTEMSLNGTPYTRSTSYGENKYISSSRIASSMVTSGITTPSDSVLIRTASSAFSRFVSRNARMSGWCAFR